MIGEDEEDEVVSGKNLLFVNVKPMGKLFFCKQPGCMKVHAGYRWCDRCEEPHDFHRECRNDGVPRCLTCGNFHGGRPCWYKTTAEYEQALESGEH